MLFIGYDERHGLVDRPNPGDDIRRVHDALSSVHNPGHFACRELRVGAARLVVVSFARRENGFAQLADGSVRQRQGASNQKLIGPALSRFQMSRSFVAFETTPTPFPLADLPAAAIDEVVATGDPAVLCSEEEQRLAVLHLAERGPVTNADVRQRLGLDRPRALGLLAALVEDGALVREGERRGTRYRLP